MYKSREEILYILPPKPYSEGLQQWTEIVAFDEQAAHAYGNIRASLEKAGTPIGSMDMLIAAHAVSLEVPLVTNHNWPCLEPAHGNMSNRSLRQTRTTGTC